MSDVKIDIEIEDGKVKRSAKTVETEYERSSRRAGRSLERNIGSSFTNLRSTALKLGASLLAAFTGRAIFRAAQVQEDAVNSLNSALINTGRFSEATSKSLQEFASELQKVTRFGDETILTAQGLIQNLANLSERDLKRATAATADLATALGIDLQSASALVGKALSGQTSILTRYGVQVQKGATEAETLNNVLGALENRFSGSAQRDVLTFSGSIAQISNNFGDLLETIGEFVTKSNNIGLIGAAIAESFNNVNKSLRETQKNFNLITDALIPVAKAGLFLAENVFPVIELVANLATGSILALTTTLATIPTIIVVIIGRIGGLLSKLRSFSPELAAIGDTFNSVASAAQDSFGALLGTTTETFSNALDFPASEILARKNQEILEGLERINATAQEQNESLASNLDKTANIAGDSAKKIAQTSQQLAQVLNQNLVRGISGGIQNIVDSVAKGQDAFANFGKFILNTAGDLAIQLGQVLIGAGIGIESLTGLQGGQAIAAGAGLVALGAVLKSLSGGTGSTASSSTSTGGNNFAPTEPAITTTDPNNLERAGEQTTLNLTVQGNIVDQDSFLTDLADGLGDLIQGRGLTVRGVNA